MVECESRGEWVAWRGCGVCWMWAVGERYVKFLVLDFSILGGGRGGVKEKLKRCWLTCRIEECDFTALEIALSMAVEWDERRSWKGKHREVEVEGLVTPPMTPLKRTTISFCFNSPRTSSETSPGSGSGSGDEGSQTTQQALDLFYLEDLKQKLSELFREYEIEHWRRERHKRGCNVLEVDGNGSRDRNRIKTYETPWFDAEDPPWVCLRDF